MRKEYWYVIFGKLCLDQLFLEVEGHWPAGSLMHHAMRAAAAYTWQALSTAPEFPAFGGHCFRVCYGMSFILDLEVFQ